MQPLNVKYNTFLEEYQNSLEVTRLEENGAVIPEHTY